MTKVTNHRVVLAARPDGVPSESDFSIDQSDVPRPAEGEVLARIIWLSLDPYMRGMMRETRPHGDPVSIGQVLAGGAVGQVVESRTPAFDVGDFVEGGLGWQEFAISDPAALRKVDRSLGPLSTAVGVLGMPGMTAYFGLLSRGGTA